MLDIERHWYRDSHNLLTALLLPLSWIFRGIVAVRRFLYQIKIKKTHRFSVPVIVVGNITIGGTGKTPFVIWLTQFLRAQGFHPGVVSRGVGGKKQVTPYWVEVHSDPNLVGDEAILLAHRTHCPVVVSIDRVAATKALLSKSACNIVVADDGLQHYRLGRDVEIAIIDGMRQFGNGSFLPAGPLRESPARLKRVNFIVIQGDARPGTFSMQLQGNYMVSVKDEHHKVPIESFSNKKIHAVAAIGNPKRFFSLLRNSNLDIIEHSFPDHYAYRAEDLFFGDNLPIIMTEKDEVKCKSFADEKHWFLPVEAKVDDRLGMELMKKLKQWRQYASS